MAYAVVKKIAGPLGIYRPARWFNRHFLNREELAQEKSELAFYSGFLRKNDLVFDVGANYGEKSRVLLKLGARVVAFEPQADCLEELQARCGNSRRLTTVQAALSSAAGTGKFYVRPHRGASGLVDNWEEDSESEMIVPTLTLDQMIAKHGRPVYIKIDVEGYEHEVLKGLTQSIPYLSLEYHLRPDDIRKACDCVHYLSRLGDIAINVTPAEQLSFAYPHWLTKEDFLRVFPSDLLGKYHYRYGDIFVRTLAHEPGNRVGVPGSPP